MGIVKAVIESSLPAVLRERASSRPGETAFTFVDYEQDWDGVAESLTWSQLYRRTLNVAQELKACGSIGDRAVILAPQGLEYIVAFLGALQAGQIAVPLSAPQGGASDERAISVLSDASPSAILTTSSIAGTVAEYIESKPGKSAPSLISVDLLDLDSQNGAAAEPVSRPDIAYLQYTSGSTRTPAGVEISHENLVVNVEQILTSYYRHRGGLPPDTTVVSWLPFFHDMGLIVGMLIPILGGFHGVVTSPPSFLQRPARWMQLLARNSRVFSAAPNIAFELAAAKTSDDDMAGLDLGDVRNILNGAERVQPATMRRFAERFARFNLDPRALRPSYGLAEATVYVATRESDQPTLTVYFDSEELIAGHAKRCASGDGTPLVSYGMPQSPTVRIVDPRTSIECPAGTVGEIWAHGDNVAAGYWQRPEESERTFGATLVDPAAGTPEGPWLRTGDLGFFSDGEMFIVGRIKDLLIVHGRNHSPDDIEPTIQEITAGRCVAIAVSDDDGPEKLVTIVELKVRGDSDEAIDFIGAVQRKITSAIAKSHGLSVADLVLVPPHSIPLTTSGKVRRRECLQRYLRDEFTRLDALIRRPKRRTVDDTGAGAEADSGWAQRLYTLRQQQHDLLVGVVCSQAATVLGRPSPDDIDPGSAFQDLGFDSVKATELLDRLKTETELALPPTLAFDYPTPDELATHLGQLLSGSVAAAPAVASRVGSDEPVAVVGMACRFPGGVGSAAGLWDLVAGGTDAMGGFPADRGWNLADLFDPDPDAVGKTYTRAGAFVADAAGFDAEFFGISAREAQTMDPQQRLLLEVCWEALETARIDAASLVGSETGVFVGAWAQPYGGGGSDTSEGYELTGSSTSVASGRVAYLLGLQGPAITVDTACSSSLVATHLACQSLLNGESALALAGGVTVMTTPTIFTEFARQRGLAADGRCKAFAAAADGTGWGEGAAVLVLERLSDAQRNNHPVLAVIAGWAINQDGASNGLTAPNGPAQQRVITQAAANAGIGLDQVDVVEAHGTGTTLGDPIEAGALIATYGASRDSEHPLWLGSIKSNIGHTQAAAGVAGMIKMIAALNHDSLPPTLHADAPSPHIDWSAATVRLLTEPVPWPVTDHPRTAAVSSFGISGTNAHLILQQAPIPPAAPISSAEPVVEPPLRIWPISARTPAALAGQAQRLGQHLIDHPDLDITEVAYSLASTRTHHPYRAAISTPVSAADPRQDVLTALNALAAGQPHPYVTQHHYRPHQGGKTVFVFAGQGGQYPAMGAQLYQHHRVFARVFDECDQALRPYTGWSVRDVICQDSAAPSLDRVEVVQPVLFAMMVSLAETLRSYAIVPDAVIGHSQGEIAAAYIAGALSLTDAAKVVALRAKALKSLGGTGTMASVLLGAPDLQPRLQPWGSALSIAAVNGPSQTIISGETLAVEQFIAACDREGIQVRPIAVDYAAHSVAVEELREHLLGEWADLSPFPARTPLYSTAQSALSSDPLDTATMDADYWYRNLREPVRFYDCVAELLAKGEHTFVELSAHPVLAPAIIDTLISVEGRTQSAVITTLHRDRPDLDTVAAALAQLHTHGHSPSWSSLYPQTRTIPLPTYPFEHRRYWLMATPSADVSAAGLDRPEHPLLGAITRLADRDEVVVSGRLSMSTQGWLTGHRVGDTVVFPATGFIDVVLAAAELVDCAVIDELVLHTPMELSEDTPTDLQIAIGPVDEQGRRAFSVHACSGEQHRPTAWTLHATGTLSSTRPGLVSPWSTVAGTEPIDADSFYEQLATQGLAYSGPFCSLQRMGSDPAHPQRVYAEVALPADTDLRGFNIHPALLDAALHPLVTMTAQPTDAEPARPRLPFALTGVSLYATGASCLHVQLLRTGTDTFRVDAVDPAGAPVITIEAITVRALPEALGRPAVLAGPREGLLELTWPVLAEDFFPPITTPSTGVLVSDQPQHLPAGLDHHQIYPDLTHPDLAHTEMVIWALPLPEAGSAVDGLSWVHAVTRHTLAGLQTWLGRPDTIDVPLVVLTRHGAAISPFDPAPELGHAAAWALLHTAQNEHPGRLAVVDIDSTTATEHVLAQVIAGLARRPSIEPQLVLRAGIACIPRLTPAAGLIPPSTPHWKLATTGKGDLSNLTLVSTQPSTELAAGQIRVAIRAAGLNFHDVVVALGAITDEGLGWEAAGVVIDTAADVTTVARGDAVMGLFQDAFAPTAITDHRSVVRVPAGWSFPQAASVPVAFLTAYAGLVELGGLHAGQRVLIHAGAGAVGQAAIQIARHVGAEVYATAHPSKHHILRGLGLDDHHIASSRTLEFAEAFAHVTTGHGMDVVLNNLSGDFIDASLQLLSRGGRFIEIGKTDIRCADQIAATHPGVAYHAYDLTNETPDRLATLWAVLTEMLNTGAITALPTTSYGLLHARQAFRHMSQARHTGKIVLVPPTTLNPHGTVLITGGTGMLGGVFAEHLITHYGIRHLLLISRRGPNAPGATELRQHLTELGAETTITACDSSNSTDLAAVLDTIPTDHPLTAVIHTAGVLDDAVITELTSQQLDTVLTAKADSAWHLHQLTQNHDLDAFIVFSSAAAALGNPGQANYAAANAVLEALAHHRHRRHLPATSLAWGYWQTPSGMTAHIDTVDQARVTRGGLAPITTEYGLALFDTALTHHQPTLIATPLNSRALAHHARHNTLPPILSALTTTRPQAATTPTTHTLATQLATQTPDQRRQTLTTLVTTATATVLAHPDPTTIDPDRPFKDLGIDSLTALELRNTLTHRTGFTMPPTVIFDRPTPTALAHYLATQLSADTPTSPSNDYIQQIQELITSIPTNRLEDADILELLKKLASSDYRDATHQQNKSRIANMDADDLIAVALRNSRTS